MSIWSKNSVLKLLASEPGVGLALVQYQGGYYYRLNGSTYWRVVPNRYVDVIQLLLGDRQPVSQNFEKFGPTVRERIKSTKSTLVRAKLTAEEAGRLDAILHDSELYLRNSR